jgi:hypothetical protein
MMLPDVGIVVAPDPGEAAAEIGAVIPSRIPPR